MKLCLVLASCLMLAAAGPPPAHKVAPHVNPQLLKAARPEWEKPSFCKTTDCPRFTVVTTNSAYEERLYEASRWVTTSSLNLEYEPSRTANFQKLFSYIDGNNVRDEKVDMTSPGITRILPGAGPACRSNFTMSFFVADKDANPPAPRDETVWLSGKNEMTVYVGHFGGFATIERFVEAAQKLRDALPETASYHTDFWYTAGYDSPFEIFNRRQEVWFIGM